MSVTKNKLQWLFSALRNDAKLLINDKAGKSARNVKTMLIGVGVFLGGALALSSFASNTEIPQEILSLKPFPSRPYSPLPSFMISGH